MKNIYITTSIPYVNAAPHIGHALELVQADAIARYYRLTGRKVFFQTGTDENAFKNVIAAGEQGVTTRQLVDRNAEIFRTLTRELSVEVDSFIRTAGPEHSAGVKALWQEITGDDIYIKSYTGRYCYGCEDFLAPRDLVEGLCPEHNKAPDSVEESNIFFRLSKYQNKIKDLIEGGSIKITPIGRKNEVLGFIKQGLHDISISRDAGRAKGWGIPVPGTPSQVVYVWIDALINYLSGIGYGTCKCWKNIWNHGTKKIHVIGKNVWKFHAIYWPALLLAAGKILPDELLVHGFLTVNGRKISKTLGNVIDPFQCIAKYGTDAARYYLLKEVSPFLDCDFSYPRLEAVYNTDLANNLGNLLSRLTVLCEKSGYGCFIPEDEIAPPEEFTKHFEEYRFDRAAGVLLDILDKINYDINTRKPWVLIKKQQDISGCLNRWLTELHRFGYWIAPFLPGTGKRILDILSLRPIRKAPPLFPRISE